MKNKCSLSKGVFILDMQKRASKLQQVCPPSRYQDAFALLVPVAKSGTSS